MGRPRKPSADEKRKLKELFTETCLMGAHGVIITNVQAGLADLLRTLNRPDLADHVEDFEKLLAE